MRTNLSIIENISWKSKPNRRVKIRCKSINRKSTVVYYTDEEIGITDICKYFISAKIYKIDLSRIIFIGPVTVGLKS